MRLTIINQYYVPALAPTAHLCASLAEHRGKLGDEVTVIASAGGYGDVKRKTASTSSPSTPGEGRGGGFGSTGDGLLTDSPLPGPPPGYQERGQEGEASLSQVRFKSVWSPRLGGSSEIRRLIDWATFYFIAFWKVLLLPRQDCLIALTTPPYIAWVAVAHRLLHRDAKIILWNMDCYPQAAELAGILPRGGWVGRLFRVINRALLRWMDHIICLDEPMVQQVFDGPPPPDWNRVTLIPNWEDLAMFPQSAIRRSHADGRLRVLYLGNAGYGHDFTTLLDAAELLRNDPVDFLFVGGGSRIAWLKSESQKRGLTSLSFRPYVEKSNTPELMRQADCALITLEDSSLGIMSPSKLHANLAMGLPILYIGPAYSNVDVAVARFGCGCSVRVGDSSSVAGFCRKLLADKSMQSQLHLLARRAFAEAYCDQTTLPVFDQVLSKVVGRAR